MLILNSEIYISLFSLLQVISFQEKPPWNAPAWTRKYIYECKTRGHGNTQQKREAANIVRSKNTQKKKLLIALVFF